MDWSAVIGAGAVIPLLAAGVRLALPTAIAAVGETVTERSGVLNLGVEGMLTAGALGAFLGEWYGNSAWVGMGAAVAAATGLGALHAVLTINLKLDQIVTGIMLVLLGVSISDFIYDSVFGDASSPPRIEGFNPVDIPGLSRIPALGVVVFQQPVVVYVALAGCGAAWWILHRTALGLSIRAAGEDPGSVAAAGRSVASVRWSAVLIGAAMSGLGGAVLVLGQLRLYSFGFVAGRGWIAIAMVILSRWTIPGALAGAFVFGVADSFQLRIQAASGGLNSNVPVEFFQMLPYAITLVVLLAASMRGRRSAAPAALGVPT